MTKVLIDFSWLYYRSKFAFKDLAVEVDGVKYATGTFHGVYLAIANWKMQYPDAEVVLVMDGKPVKHLAIDLGYKGSRDHSVATDVREFTKWDVAKHFTVMPHVSIQSHSQMEADETIAFLCMLKEPEDMYIVHTSDGDMRQLISTEQKVYCTHKLDEQENFILEDEKYLREVGTKDAKGLSPDAVPMFLAIVGDSSDSIDGIARFRKAKAVEIANVYKNPDSLRRFLFETDYSSSPMVKDLNKVRDHFAQVAKSYSLTKLDPLGIPKESTFEGEEGIGLPMLQLYKLNEAYNGVSKMIDGLLPV